MKDLKAIAQDAIEAVKAVDYVAVAEDTLYFGLYGAAYVGLALRRVGRVLLNNLPAIISDLRYEFSDLAEEAEYEAEEAEMNIYAALDYLEILGPVDELEDEDEYEEEGLTDERISELLDEALEELRLAEDLDAEIEEVLYEDELDALLYSLQVVGEDGPVGAAGDDILYTPA